MCDGFGPSLPVVSVNVAQLLLDAPGATRDVDFVEPLSVAPSDGLRLSAPVRGSIHMTLTNRGVLARVQYATRVSAECARCLDPVDVPLQGSFSEEFRPFVNIRTGTPLREDDDPEEDVWRIDEHHMMHLDEPLRQDILTSLPIQPLCDAACPGLCPTCGQRMGPNHPRHPGEPAVILAPPELTVTQPRTHQPFANLADLLNRQDPESRAN